MALHVRILAMGVIYWLLAGVACQATVEVVDGDTININQQEIRLYGIDAPEMLQQCRDASGQMYACGEVAAYRLNELINSETRCEFLGTDRYQRPLAICYTNGININARMVSLGLALAYSLGRPRPYLNEEKFARHHRHGLWQGQFIRPEQWRQENRTLKSSLQK